MWYHIGRKLKALAKVICWLGIIGSVIGAIVLWSQNNGYRNPTILSGFLCLGLGCLGSWIGSWTLYGLGLVVEYVENKSDISPKEGTGSSDSSAREFKNNTISSAFVQDLKNMVASSGLGQRVISEIDRNIQGRNTTDFKERTVEELKKYKELLDQGEISEEEFQAIKEKLLQDM